MATTPRNRANARKCAAKRFFGQSCKRSLDKVTRRAYVLSIGKRKEMHMTFTDAVATITAVVAVVAVFGLVGLTFAAAVDVYKKI